MSSRCFLFSIIEDCLRGVCVATPRRQLILFEDKLEDPVRTEKFQNHEGLIFYFFGKIVVHRSPIVGCRLWSTEPEFSIFKVYFTWPFRAASNFRCIFVIFRMSNNPFTCLFMSHNYTTIYNVTF